MVHAFLAVMGGIAVEIKDNNPGIGNKKRIANFIPIQRLKGVERQRTRLTLTPNGLQFLKKLGRESLIPNLFEDRIQDKSKGSAFAKTLIYIQSSHLSFPEPIPKLTNI